MVIILLFFTGVCHLTLIYHVFNLQSFQFSFGRSRCGCVFFSLISYFFLNLTLEFILFMFVYTWCLTCWLSIWIYVLNLVLYTQCTNTG